MTGRAPEVVLDEREQAARACYKSQDYDGSLKCATPLPDYASATSGLDPDRAYRLTELRCASLQKLQRYDDAVVEAKQMIRLEPNKADGYIRAGRLLQALEKTSNALLVYRRGLNLLDRSSDDYRRLQDKYLAMKDAIRDTKRRDPCASLPLEVVELIMSYLTFDSLVRCTGVNRHWRKLLQGLPPLWRTMDLSCAKRNVPTMFATRCLNRARNDIRVAHLERTKDLDKIVLSLAKQCSRFEDLTIKSATHPTTTFAGTLGICTNLRHLSISTAKTTAQDVMLIMRYCPQLISLEALGITGPPDAHSSFSKVPRKLKGLILRVEESGNHTGRGYENLFQLDKIIEHNPFLEQLIYKPSSSQRVCNVDFARLEQLQSLDIDSERIYCSNIPPGMRHLTANIGASNVPDFELPTLEHLEVYSLRHACILLRNGSEFSELKTLAIRSGYHINDDLIPVRVADIPIARLGKVTNLTMVMPTFSKVDDELVPFICASMPLLEHVDLSCTDLTGVGIRQLVLQLQYLKSLVVVSCPPSPDAIAWARSKDIIVTTHLSTSMPLRESGRRLRFE